MNKRTKFLLGIGVIAALVIGWQVAAFAVHDTGAFELEGNAVDDATPGDDWENVFNGNTTGATDTAFVTEPNKNSSIFTGGGSKDPQDTSNWQWKDDAGGLPDKANLEHSFAATYDTSEGEVLFFGADRFDGSGDAAIAFWFFQNEVTQSGTGSGTFSGVHKNGDLLVISNFSNGGTVSTITVYKWDTTCTKGVNNPTAGQCGAENLRVVATSTDANCDSPNPDTACAIVNSDTETAPWDFLDKDGNTDFLKGEFFEGGVNLTELGLSNTCFATALAETRTSTSPTSVLKDFTLGAFGQCGGSVVTTPKDGSGNDIPAGGLTLGPNGVQATDSATVTVTGTSTWEGTVTFFLCGPLTSATGCATGGTQVGTAKNVSSATPPGPTALSDPTTLTQPGIYCWRAFFDSNTNGVPDATDASTNECFTVNDTSSITTAQRWLLNDTATVTLAGGGNPDGTVTFKLYENGTCSEPAAQTFTDSTVPYETNNTTFYTSNQTISWKASFVPTDSAVGGSTGVCETSSVTIDNDGP